jgi:hypothetical protein
VHPDPVRGFIAGSKGEVFVRQMKKSGRCVRGHKSLDANLSWWLATAPRREGLPRLHAASLLANTPA